MDINFNFKTEHITLLERAEGTSGSREYTVSSDNGYRCGDSFNISMGILANLNVFTFKTTFLNINSSDIEKIAELISKLGFELELNDKTITVEYKRLFDGIVLFRFIRMMANREFRNRLYSLSSSFDNILDAICSTTLNRDVRRSLFETNDLLSKEICINRFDSVKSFLDYNNDVRAGQTYRFKPFVNLKPNSIDYNNNEEIVKEYNRLKTEYLSLIS